MIKRGWEVKRAMMRGAKANGNKQPRSLAQRGVEESTHQRFVSCFFTSADKILNRHALKRLSYVSNSRTIFVLQKNGEPWRMWSQYSSAWVNLTQARPSLGQVDPGSEGQGYGNPLTVHNLCYF